MVLPAAGERGDVEGPGRIEPGVEWGRGPFPRGLCLGWSRARGGPCLRGSSLGWCWAGRTLSCTKPRCTLLASLSLEPRGLFGPRRPRSAFPEGTPSGFLSAQVRRAQTWVRLDTCLHSARSGLLGAYWAQVLLIAPFFTSSVGITQVCSRNWPPSSVCSRPSDPMPVL